MYIDGQLSGTGPRGYIEPVSVQHQRLCNSVIQYKLWLHLSHGFKLLTAARATFSHFCFVSAKADFLGETAQPISKKESEYLLAVRLDEPTE